MLTEKLEIEVFTIQSKILYNHAFLPRRGNERQV